MVRGFYTAASGMVSQEKRLNTIANNIANVGTVGYKKDDLVYGTFGEHLAVRMNTYQQSPLYEQGRGVFMQVIDEKYTDHGQGGFDFTERPFDMAIQGDGYFVIRDENGDMRLTRDGQFALDADGFLVLPGFGRVQGSTGDIQLGTSNFSVAADGTVYLLPDPDEDDDEATAVARIRLGLPADGTQLEKDVNGLFVSENITYFDAGIQNTYIGQGVLEKSNVDMTEEMTRMIASQRSLQSSSQLVRMYDEMSEQANTRIARV